jgi:hypothetical protein
MINRLILATLIAVLLQGCTVGRFVTNVSSNGVDGLNVEKCTTKRYDNFFWDTECGTISVPIQSVEKNSR